jgi:hypothetical protein
MILITKMFLKCRKMFFWGRGYMWRTLTGLTRLTKPTSERGLWSIYNQVWSIYFTQIDHNICFHLLALQALVNLVNFFRYTPPHESKTGQFRSKFGQSSFSTLTKR